MARLSSWQAVCNPGGGDEDGVLMGHFHREWLAQHVACMPPLNSAPDFREPELC